MHLVDSLGQSAVAGIPLMHEQSCAIAADAYAQSTGGLGVCLVTTGPGGTNAITGVASSWLDSTPLLVLSGQVQMRHLEQHGARQNGFQELDICSLVEPITKRAVRVRDAQNLADDLDELIRETVSGRPGPIWIDIPLDLQCAEIVAPPTHRSVRTKVSVHESTALQLDRLVEAITEARRPLLLLGNGVRLSNSTDAFVKFIEDFDLPTVLSWKAIDFLPAQHRLNFGRPGILTTRYANLAVESCDLLISCGARLDMGQAAYQVESIAPTAQKYSIDIDATEFGKYRAHGFECIEMDAGSFLRALMVRLNQVGATRNSPSQWINQLEEWRQRFSLENEPRANEFDVYQVLDVLSEEMPPLSIFAPGSSGACSEVSMQAFRNRAGQRVFNSEGLGSMGFGVPAAIGAAIAHPSVPVVCVDGDGGFIMNFQELSVAVQRSLPILWIVLCNDGYGSIRVTQDNYFAGRRFGCDHASGLALPELAGLSKAMGLKVVKVDQAHALNGAVKQFFDAPCPTVVCAHVSSDTQYGPRVASRRNSDGTMSSANFINLHPPLTADENIELEEELNRLQS